MMLRAAIQSLSGIEHEHIDEQVLDRIFSPLLHRKIKKGGQPVLGYFFLFNAAKLYMVLRPRIFYSTQTMIWNKFFANP